MSFGFSVGDVIAVGNLATSIYKQCRDSPGQYHELADDARQLAGVLQDIQDIVSENVLEPDQASELVERSQSCRAVLADLNDILERHKGMSSKSKRVFTRFKWDQGEFRDIKQRMMSTVIILQTFYSRLTNSSLIRIQRALDQFVLEIRQGHRDADSVSVLTNNVGEEEEEAWWYIIRDLEDMGISPDVASQNRPFILNWFVEAINSGKLQAGQSPVDDSVDSASTIAVGGLLPPKIEHRPLHSRARSTPNLKSESVGVNRLSTSSTAPQVMESFHLGDLNEKARSSTDLTQLTQNPLAGLSRIDHELVDLWNQGHWKTAAKTYEDYAAKSRNRGATRMSTHLNGLSASLEGRLEEAKGLFESNIPSTFSPYVSGSFDELTIVAARWLGDTCVQLGETENAVLAWAVAALMIRSRQHNKVNFSIQELNTVFAELRVVTTTAFQQIAQASDILPFWKTEKKVKIIQDSWKHAESRFGSSNEQIKDFARTEQNSIALSKEPLYQQVEVTGTNILRCDPLLSVEKLDLTQKALLRSVNLVGMTKLLFVSKRGAAWLFDALFTAVQKKTWDEYKGKALSKQNNGRMKTHGQERVQVFFSFSKALTPSFTLCYTFDIVSTPFSMSGVRFALDHKHSFRSIVFDEPKHKQFAKGFRADLNMFTKQLRDHVRLELKRTSSLPNEVKSG